MDKPYGSLEQHFDLRPYGITKMLDLLHPMYQATAAYGHFGRTPEEVTVDGDTFTTFTWEKTDKAEALTELPAPLGLRRIVALEAHR